MSFSQWINIDLHIHSPESNKVKPNDYKNALHINDIDKYINDLQIKIKSESLKIISIADHNIINFELYEKLITNEKFEEIGILPAIEINFFDELMPTQKFHALVLLNTDSIDQLKSFQELFHSCHNTLDKETKWTLAQVYESMFKASIREYLIIPHYNNKNKGISINDLEYIDKFYSPLAIFGAFEDGSNPANLQHSMEMYQNEGINDLPVVSFSDSHDVSDTNFKSSTSVMGSAKSPFNTLKLAFSHPELRVSCFDSVNDNISKRSSHINYNYIKSITLDEQTIELSPYQNTIIGGFGSGKSFLKTLILEGIDEVRCNHKEYEEHLSKLQNFSIKDSNSASLKGINLSNNINYLALEQNSEIFFKNTMTLDIKNDFEKNFNIKFPVLECLKFDEFNEEYFQSLQVLFDEINVNDGEDIEFAILQKRTNFTYPKPATIITKIPDDAFLTPLLEINKLASFKFLYDKGIFTKQEQEDILNSTTFIDNFFKKAKERYINVKKQFIEIDKILNDYLEKNASSETARTAQIKKIEGIKQNVFETKESIAELSRKINQLTSLVADVEIFYDELQKAPITINTKDKYILQTKRVVQNKLIPGKFYDAIFNKDFRKQELFEGVIKTKLATGCFHRKQQLAEALKNWIETYFKNNMNNFEYDLKIVEETTTKSLFSSSPGERANKILNLIFDLIEELSEEKMNILILDQPEDNLDNKNIYSEVVNSIKKLKITNKHLQIIMVSHNPNITIAADSENIIIAQKIDNFFRYDTGGLETLEHANNICNIIEGGKEALQERGIKLGVNYKKTRWTEWK